ncbi:hypothetical protein [Bradyrhizobium sp. SRS-191]|uniref:hypothetical protein n=1 Tax=Bradyrhizobium sp. SRS-191 TaxID=2962606 RepID=UPI00211DD388|nr:hypothetical protein [Bradyrhizobium sp. SRS-191]
MPQRDEKRIVDGILGLRTVAEHAECRSVQPCAMAFQQHPKAGTIAATRRNGQFGIARPDISLMFHGAIDAPAVEKVRTRRDFCRG